MSAVLNSVTSNPVSFGLELGYMFVAMFGTNFALEFIDEAFIAKWVPSQLQGQVKLIAKSAQQAIQFKIAQFY